MRIELDLLYKSIQQNIKAELSELCRNYAVQFSVTLDTWTASNQDEYLGITIHYLNSEWVLHSKLLIMQDIEQRHSSKYILQIFEECLDIYDIKDKLIRYIFHLYFLKMKY